MAGEPLPRRGVALVIGVGDYQDKGVTPLKYAVNDAEALAEMLTDPDVCGFPANQVELLTDDKAHRDAIVDRLSNWLPARSKGADIVVIYFAGHGVVRSLGKKEEGYLLPYDADPTNPAARGVAMGDLARWVDGLAAEAVVVCLDCCHAGKALATRGPEPAVARDVGIGPAALQEIAGKGRFIMASCDAGQRSVEDPVLRHGLFTYHLLQGISGKGDRDGNGKVGVAELFEYVSEQVVRDARKHGVEQKPWTVAMAAGGVYISAPRIRPAEVSPVPPDEAELVNQLKQAGKIADPLAVPFVVPHLAHKAEAVRVMAKRAIQGIGIKQTFMAIEELARRGDPALGPILDGLAAFEARPDLVQLLDRLVDHVSGDLLVRAIALLDRKRLGLGLEAVRELFARISSQYELRRVLGQGLFTAAYLAHDSFADMEVVVRVLLEKFVREPEVRKQFVEVCKQSIKFGHHNLVRTLEVRAFPDDQAYYTVRAHVTGVTLRDILAGGRRFEPLQVVEILRQLLGGLAVLHPAGVCHGGVKPSNIFVCPGDRVVLGDLAPTMLLSAPADPRVAYNYRYTSPEAFRSETVGPPADLYALGCVAYELFCGVPPFLSDKPHDLLIGHLTGRIPPVRTHQPDLPAAVQDFLDRLLAPTVAGRPQHAETAFVELDTLRDALRRPKPSPVVPVPPPIPPKPDHPPPSPVKLEPPVLHYDLAVPRTPPRRPPEPGVPPSTPPRRPPEPAPVTPVPVEPRTSDSGITTVPPDRPSDDSGTVPPQTYVPLVAEASMAQYRPAETAMSVGVDHSMGTVARAPEFPTIPGYEVLGILGRGGMGSVYKARQISLNRLVALKLIEERWVDTTARSRFMAEAEFMAAIRHSNVVQVYDYGGASGVPYIALEYLPGGSLAERLQRLGGTLQTSETVEVLTGVARGLVAAHSRGIIHRDVKPANILFDETGVPKLTDFGLARQGTGELTQTQAVMGTPAYMSPEQASGDNELVGSPSDVWSFGVMLYECISGRRPFRADRPHAMLRRIIDEAAVPLRELVPDVPPDLEAICQKCMEKNPADRYPTAAELVADLERFSQGRPTEAHLRMEADLRTEIRLPTEVRPLSRWRRFVRWVKRRFTPR